MITYLVGDATKPVGFDDRIVILVHICNDIGAWGSGFVVALSRRFDMPGLDPEEAYREWHRSPPTNLPFQLGEVQLVRVDDDTYVANMIAQKGIKQSGKDFDIHADPPIRYEAVEKCLNTVAVIAKSMGASVVGPRFGAGLAGGSWLEIEKIINKTMDGIPVFIYDLPKK